LHLQYISLLVSRDIVSLANVLVALLKTSAARIPAASTSPDISFQPGAEGLHRRETLEQDVFLVLANVLVTHKPRSSESVWTAVQAMGDWMEAITTASGAGIGGTVDAEGIAVVTMAADVPTKGRLGALGEMVVALGANEHAVKILGEGGRREKKLGFQTSLSLFTQFIQVQNPPLASKLEGLRLQFQTQSPRQQRAGLKSNAGETIDGMMMGLGADIVEVGPVVWTRGHLFVWLNGLVSSTPGQVKSRDC
jgi:mediator of RNA polymerase II transcription subunit 5